MNEYKKIIPKNMRYKILKFLRFVPDKYMLYIQYYVKLNRKLNLISPKRYTEKIQWYKLNYRDSLMTLCADKYKVREFITRKGLSDILVDLYGIYGSIDDINFEELPEKFVIKANNGSGTNVICRNKSKLNKRELSNLFSEYKKQTSCNAGREWVYYNIEYKIIVEELLEDCSNANGDINDYKILCFNGKPEYIVLDIDRFTNHKRNIYDVEWNNLHVSTDCSTSKMDYEKPKKLDEMLKIAKILSENFPAVRVDLYYVNNKIYFGELTFFPWSGYVQFIPDQFDFILGEKFNIGEKFDE